MVGIQISKKNHEKLCAIRDEENLKSFNEVLDHVLPDGAVSIMDFEKKPPAFALMNGDEVLNISWNELEKAELSTEWQNGKEKAKIIYKDDEGVLIRFEDEYGEVYLNYFHFI